MKVNYCGDVFELNQINDELWISEPTDQGECLVFESYNGTWYHGFYTSDECVQLISDIQKYTAKEIEMYDLDEKELTDEMIDLILSGTDEMLEMLAACMVD